MATKPDAIQVARKVIKDADSHSALLKLVESVVDPANPDGWQISSLPTGTRVSAPGNTESVVIPGHRTGQTWDNAVARLIRMGLPGALIAAAVAAERKEAAKLAADREKAERRAAGLPQPLTQTVGSLVGLAFQEPTRPASTPANGAVPANGSSTVSEMDVKLTESGLYDHEANTYTDKILVTPAMAKEWRSRPPARLSDGTELIQRKLSAELVIDYAGRMLRGEWRLTQSIALAPEEPWNTGGNVNGQHRLAAVELADVPVFFRVDHNVNPDWFNTYDNGKRRSLADTLHSLGKGSAHLLGSAARLLWAYLEWEQDPEEYATWSAWARLRPSDPQILTMLAEHSRFPEHLGKGVSMMPPRGRGNGGIPAAGAVFRYLAERAWPDGVEVLDEFCHRVSDGQHMAKGDPVYTVRNWLQRGGVVTTRRDELPDLRANAYRRETQLVGLITAWGKHCTNQPMHLLTVYRDGPIPPLYVPRRTRVAS